MLKRFRLAVPRKWLAQSCFDQLQDAQRYAPILLDPITQIFAEFGMKDGFAAS